jgi:hypothetical protein
MSDPMAYAAAVLRRCYELAAFIEEEGVRFGTGYLGSVAVEDVPAAVDATLKLLELVG